MKTKLHIIFFILICSTCLYSASIKIRTGSNGERCVTLDLPEIEVITGQRGQAVFSCKDIQWLSRSGEPRIPWKVVTVLLGPDAELSSVACRIVQTRYESLEGAWIVKPTPPAATRDGQGHLQVVWPAGKRIISGQDVDIYRSDTLWPEKPVHLLGVGKLHHWKLVKVAIPLVRYRPESGQLAGLTSAEIAVHCKHPPGTRKPSESIRPINLRGRSRVCRMAVNFDQTVAAYEALAFTNKEAEAGTILEKRNDGRAFKAELDPTGYTIITTQAIQNTSNKLDTFVAHKQSLGFDVQVVTESDFGGGQGDEGADNIRAWLQANYMNDDILYVLLIGNPIPANGDIPMKMCYEYTWRLAEMPTDLFYSDLSGDWDLNGDGYYGEGEDFGPGGIDLYWEVLVGRIPCYGNISDTDAILQKSIDYEIASGADTYWRRNVLLPMVPMDDSTPSYQLGEQIKHNLLEPEAITCYRLYAEDYGVIPPPEMTPCTVQNVTDAWSNTPFGLVVWLTHGWAKAGVNVMDTDHVPYLNDDFPSATYQSSCDNAYPEYTDNLSYEILKNGGIATSGATRSGWYYVGETNFTYTTSEPGLGYQYALRLVTGVSCGQAHFDTRQDMVPGLWKNYTLHNIYGDPSLVIIPPAPKFIITGPGPGVTNPPRVRIFPAAQDTGYDYEFNAYGSPYYGVDVHCGDVNWDPLVEILTGAGPGHLYGPHVRGFQIDGTPLSGLSFIAYGTRRYGVNIATGDIDSDDFDEILTGAGPGAVFGPHVRAFNYDGTSRIEPVPGVSFMAYGARRWGVNVAGGDIDHDGFDEIITGAGPGNGFGPHVRAWNVDDGSATVIPKVSFFAYGTKRRGVVVTCGDADGDSIDEIVTAPGPSAAFASHIRGWNFDDEFLTPLPNFSFFAWPPAQAGYGAHISAGADLAGNGCHELVVGTGPDPEPSIGAAVRVYLYDGHQPAEWFSLQAYPSSWTHGVNVTALAY